MRDKPIIYSDKQAVLASGQSNEINFSVANADPGEGRPIFLNISVSETYNNLTSMTFKYQHKDDGGSYTDVWSKVVLLADLSAGKEVIRMALPKNLKQITRIDYTVTGTAPTTGKIEAWLDL